MPLLNDATAVYRGAAAVSRIYRGATEVWAPPPGGFDFASVPGLWLDFDPISLALADGDPVASWTDSHSGLALSQATASWRPVYQTAGPNGKPAVRGDGVDDELRGPIAAYSGHVTHFIVYRPHTSVPSNAYVLDVARNSATIIAGYEANGMVEFYRSLNGNSRFNAGTSGTGVWAVHEMVTGASANRGFKDGVLVESVAAHTPGWPDSDLYMFSTYLRSAFVQADIARLLTYKASVSDADRASIRAELGQLYGITVS